MNIRSHFPIRVFFLLRILQTGGAERQLFELIKGMDKTRFAITVATFYDNGDLQEDFAKIPGVRLILLHKKRRWDTVSFLWRLWCALIEAKPHIVHGYMGVVNELALMGKIQGAKVVWGLRTSNLDFFTRRDWLVRWSFWCGSRLSPFADSIILNSRAGKKYYRSCGYCGRKMRVIHNGIDSEYFSPAPGEGKFMRYTWGVKEDTPLIGIIARMDPIKDLTTFVEAAAILSSKFREVRFVCVGMYHGDYAEKVYNLADTLGVHDKMIWVQARGAMRAVYNALDIVTSCSQAEGFPNVVAEAMSCCVPCVVTDVGDSKWIVSNTGLVIPVRQPIQLAKAWYEILNLPKPKRTMMGQAARERIITAFSKNRLILETQNLFCALISH